MTTCRLVPILTAAADPPLLDCVFIYSYSIDPAQCGQETVARMIKLVSELLGVMDRCRNIMTRAALAWLADGEPHQRNRN